MKEIKIGRAKEKEGKRKERRISIKISRVYLADWVCWTG